MHGNTKHGLTYKIPEYGIWAAIKRRCHNPNALDYPRYGGRGITVCDRWKDSFETFLADMGRRPSNTHQIDRIDNQGPYSPENCRWISAKENSRNRRSNTLLTYKGETKTLAEWSEICNIKPATICMRLYRSKWSIEKTLETPVRTPKNV